jgi:hypothetical protein
MIQTIDFEQVIIQGIKDLPKQYLGEVADFVVFLRFPVVGVLTDHLA